jgi:MFS family permease
MDAARSRLRFTLLVLLGINTMNFFDRQVLGAVAEPIKKQWGLSDGQVGWLGTAFTLLYAVVGLPLGRWADVGRRKIILAGGAGLWSLLTVLSGFAWNFWSLFVFRLGVGVGEASCAPASTSLLGDLFPAERRSRAMAVFMFGLPLGLGCSFLISGWMAKAWGWRAALYVAGAPGLVLALLSLALPEPPRGAVETHAIGSARRPGFALLQVLTIPTMWWLIIAGAIHNFNMYALGTFLASFLQRHYLVDPSQAGLISGVCYGFSGGIGILIGGWACDRWARRRLGGRLEVAALALLPFAPCTFFALWQTPAEPWGFGLLLLPACAFSYVFYAGTYPTIQDIVEPALRGTAMAVFFFAFYLLGAAAGPVAMGWLSDYFARSAAAAEGVEAVSALHKAVGLRQAMGLLPILGAALVVVLFIASRTVRADYWKLQQWMKAQTAGENPG